MLSTLSTVFGYLSLASFIGCIIFFSEEGVKNKRYNYLLNSFMFLFFVFLACSLTNWYLTPSSSNDNASSQVVTASQPVKEKPAPPVKRNEDILGDSVEKGLSGFPSMLCTLQSVEINAGANDTSYVVINLKAKLGYNKESTLTDFDNSAKYIFKEVYMAKIPVKISNCKIIFNSKLVNTKTGEEASEGIYAISLDSAVASQIHWDKISNIDISQSVNDRYIHPAFRSMK